MVYVYVIKPFFQAVNSSYEPPQLSTHFLKNLGELPNPYGTIEIMFPIYCVYSMAYITMFLCAGIVDDKYKKIKDHMVMMGMNPGAYW